MKNIRLVIADNHQIMREAWRHVLGNDSRLEVLAACESHDEVIKYCHSLQPDIILLNISLNFRKDIATVEYILKKYPAIKVIGISMDTRLLAVRALFEAGAQGFVTKSSSKEEMIKAIISVMRGNTYLCEEVGSSFK